MSAKWLLHASATSPGEVKTWFPGYFGSEYKMAEQSFHSFHEEEIRELLTKNQGSTLTHKKSQNANDFDNLRVTKISTNKRLRVRTIHVSQTFGESRSNARGNVQTTFKRPSGPSTSNTSASGDEDLEPPKNKSLKSESNRDNTAHLKKVENWGPIKTGWFITPVDRWWPSGQRQRRPNNM